MLLHHYRFEPDTSLFDLDLFRTELAGSRSPIAPFKAALREIQARLDERFRAGSDIRDLVRGRAWYLDQLLAIAWAQHAWPDDGVALVAVGGYGRGELHPHSDIDLLLLLEHDDDTPYREPLSAFITFLWDIGLEIGHSVRSLNDCEREAEADVTVITNLLESRLIAGPESLREKMRERLSTPNLWPADRFFEAKWQEQIARHYRYNNSEYHLEPNLKSSPGGLRDIQMIGWVAKRHFGTEQYTDIVGDCPLNLEATHLGLVAYMITGEEQYRNWVVDYVDAWVQRTDDNGGIIPSNIGLDGSIGGAADGNWWGGCYGWGFTVTVPQTGARANRPACYSRPHYGFANGLLMSGKLSYIDTWRGVIEAVNANAKEIDGRMHYPYMHGDEGWFDYRPHPFSSGALEVWYWSQDRQDLERVRGDGWVSFLEGDNPSYPERAIEQDLERLRQKLERMRAVTPAQVSEFSRGFLGPSNRAVLTYVPAMHEPRAKEAS